MTSLRPTCRVQRDYNPISWTEYFDEALDITIERESTAGDASDLSNDSMRSESVANNSFRVYLRNFKKPYAPGRTSGQYANHEDIDVTAEERTTFSQIPTLVMLHGGGYSALTWAQFVRHVEKLCHCRILAIDLRSHGDTKTTNDDQMNIKNLVSDVIDVTHKVHRVTGFADTPKTVVIGHSMGGAIAIKCAARCAEELPSLVGLIVIDVVEGTAKDALPLMMSVIKTRPTKFTSLQNAIEWCVRSGMAKNLDAAKVSMPGNLVNITTNELAIHDLVADGDDNQMIASIKRHKHHIALDQLLSPRSPSFGNAPLPPRVSAIKSSDCEGLAPAHVSRPVCRGGVGSAPHREDVIEESSDEMDAQPGRASEVLDDDGYKRPPEVAKCGYAWRTNLAKTNPFWSGWFEGLSSDMLSAPVQGRLLLLAGIDRLDKTLTIGQMQGKFMMKVLPKCGHAVHEDVPEKVAQAIGDFLLRNKFTTAVAD